MESILVTVLVGCFLLVMAPAAFATLLDPEAVGGDAVGTPTPVAPLAIDAGSEPEARLAA